MPWDLKKAQQKAIIHIFLDDLFRNMQERSVSLKLLQKSELLKIAHNCEMK